MSDNNETTFRRICDAYFGHEGEGCTLEMFLRLKSAKQNECIAKVRPLMDISFLEEMVSQADAKRSIALHQHAPVAPLSAMGITGPMGMAGLWNPSYGTSFPPSNYGIGLPMGPSTGMSIAQHAASTVAAAKLAFPASSNTQSAKFKNHANKGKQ